MLAEGPTGKARFNGTAHSREAAIARAVRGAVGLLLAKPVQVDITEVIKDGR